MSSPRHYRLLVSSFVAACVFSVGGLALAAIISGTSSSGVSANVTITRLAINKPTAAVGDVMLASIAINGGSTVNITAPAGWTQIARIDNDVNVALISYWKVTTATEPSSYTWTVDQQTRAVGGITPYSGVDVTNPIDSFGVNTGFGTSATTSSVTASLANEQVVAFFATDVNKALSIPTGMTEKYNLANAPLGPTTAADDMVQTSSGTVSSKSSTITGNKARNWATQQIVLRVVPPVTTAFRDDFTRADGAVGNGWTMAQDNGHGCTQGISNSRYFNTSHWDGACWITRSDIAVSTNFALYTEFSGAGLINGRDGTNLMLFFRGVTGHGDGYGLVIDAGGVTSPNLIIMDNQVFRATGSYSFNNTDTFAVEMDYNYAMNWWDMYVWNKTIGSKPAAPTISFHNGGNAYTPIASGSVWSIDWNHNGSGIDDTAYTYVYQVSSM